jgi:hypothetical protein
VIGLAAVVMATLEREKAATRLGRKVNAEVVFDAGGSKPSALRGHVAALRHATDTYLGTTHILVLQEDAIPCPGFPATLLDVVAARPDSLISLYIGTHHGGQAAYRRRMRSCQRFSPLPLNHFVPTVGIVWPAMYAKVFCNWVGQVEDTKYDDEAIRVWRQRLHRQGVEIDAVASIPSLVKHDNDLPSVIGHRHHGRREPICAWDSWQGREPWTDGW